MDTYTHNTGMPAHKDNRLNRWLRKEIDSLSAKKEALDAEYPRHAKHIPLPQLRSIAYHSLLHRLCRPVAGD